MAEKIKAGKKEENKEAAQMNTVPHTQTEQNAPDTSSAPAQLNAALHALAERLPQWFLENKRTLPWRGTGNPYDVWLSEIMLQQTRVEAVKGYFLRFREALPDIRSLAECSDERLMKLWEGLGYYSRVRNLKKAAQKLVAEYGGKLPADEKALLSLPGIGSYTAGAIASIAYGLPVPAVDGNVLRVCMRVSGNRADIARPETKKMLEQALRTQVYSRFAANETHENSDAGADRGNGGERKDACTGRNDWTKNRAGLMTQALMELGAIVCVPNGDPLCGVCPVNDVCMARLKGETDVLPVKSAKKPRRIEERTVLVIRNGNRYLIRKRPEKGLLAGLWELPSVNGHLNETEAVREAERMGYEPLRVEKLPDAKHIFTHIEWHMNAWLLRLSDTEMQKTDGLKNNEDAAPAASVFAEPQALRDIYALPSAFQAYVDAIKNET